MLPRKRAVIFAHVDDDSWLNLVFTYHGLWPHMWRPLLLWLTTWYFIEIVEELVVQKASKDIDNLFHTIDKHKDKIQMLIVFVLGYYVTSIYQRWLALYESIPWPDAVCMTLHTSMPEDHKQDIKMTMMRYLMVTQAIAFMWVSPAFVEHYPNLEALMKINLITEEERHDLNRCFVANDYEAAQWVSFLWFQNLVLAYYRNGDIDSERNVDMIMCEARSFYDDLRAFTSLAQKQLPVGYIQLAVSVVWGNYYLTLFCNHRDVESVHWMPPHTAILVNWLLLGVLFVSHEMLYPLRHFHGIFGSNSTFRNSEEEFDLVALFEKNIRLCKVMLLCPLIDKESHEERKAELAEMEEKLKEAEEQQQRMAAEKASALIEMERIEQKLEDAQREHAEADSKTEEEIEKAKEAIRLAQEEAEKAKQDLERVHAEHERAEQERHEAEKERLRIEKKNLAEEKKLLEAEKKHAEEAKTSFPTLLTKVKRLPKKVKQPSSLMNLELGQQGLGMKAVPYHSRYSFVY